MEQEQVRAIFVFAIDEYFKDILNDIDSINPSSKSRGQVAQLYEVMLTAANECTPTVLARDVPRPAYRLMEPGTEMFYRIVRLEEGGANELAAMLAVDASRIPESIMPAINAQLAPAPELELVKIVMFALKKGPGIQQQSVMLLVAKTADGEMHTIPYRFRWGVSGKVVGGEDIADKAEEEQERLVFLVHIIMNEDAGTLHNAQGEGSGALN